MINILDYWESNCVELFCKNKSVLSFLCFVVEIVDVFDLAPQVRSDKVEIVDSLLSTRSRS